MSKWINKVSIGDDASLTIVNAWEVAHRTSIGAVQIETPGGESIEVLGTDTEAVLRSKRDQLIEKLNPR